MAERDRQTEGDEGHTRKGHVEEPRERLRQSSLDRVPDGDQAGEHKDNAEGDDQVNQRPVLALGDDLCQALGLMPGRDRVQQIARSGSRAARGGYRR